MIQLVIKLATKFTVPYVNALGYPNHLFLSCFPSSSCIFVAGGATADDDSVKLNLQHLTDWGVFENADAIAEVSAEASGESSMEAMLKTVSQ